MNHIKPPFELWTGDENPNAPGTGAIHDKEHMPFDSWQEAEQFANRLPVWRFWEVRDAAGTVVKQGYVAPPPVKKKPKTGKLSKVVKPKIAKARKAKMVKPKRPKRK